MKKILEVKNLRKSFGGVDVLKGVSLSVGKGDVVAVLGPSGAGKTTLLRCLNFLERADAGSMRFGGDVYDFGTVSGSAVEAVRRQTGFVFQNYNLFRNKTALQNVTEGLITAQRVPERQARDAGLSALDKVGMAGKRDAWPHQLSGGQQQRVAIARALVTHPKIIFFDEPTSALDPELTGEVLAVMRQLAAEGMTMLVVTHEVHFARHVSSKVMFMENGLMVEFSDSKTFFNNPGQERTRSFLRALRDGGGNELRTSPTLPTAAFSLQ